MPASYPRIPYGEADFKRIRLNGWLYVDKTRFVHALEDERYVFLIRPRRFGKSCWVSLLDNYYRPQEEPTTSRRSSAVRTWGSSRPKTAIATSSLRFNFSAFDDTLDTLRKRFEEYCQMVIRQYAGAQCGFVSRGGAAAHPRVGLGQ